MKLIHFFLILIFFLSCHSNVRKNERVFIGGDIVNPVNNYVVLYDTNDQVDTIYLNSDNKFFHYFTDFNNGIHSFVHGGKYQSLLLEHNDSIMMHINTQDFDGSLNFNGIGAKKNNYLTKLLLKLENQNSINNNLYKLDPVDFNEIITSKINENSEELNLFLKENPNSDLFEKIAISTIKYHYFTKKELYPHRSSGHTFSTNPKKTPSNFYDFRKEIVYNDKDLKDFYPYYNFLFPHINNLSYEELKANQTICDLESNNLEYTNFKLTHIDSLVTNSLIKNNLLKYTVRNFISNSKSIDKSYILYQSYLDKSTNMKDKIYIKNLFKNIQGLQPGHQLPSVDVVDNKNIKSNINSIFNKTTVLYFWDNANRYHFENSHIKAKTLTSLFPEIKFIAININSIHTNAWKNMIYAKKYKLNDEYRFANPSFAKKRLAINYIKKVLIVNKNGIILNSTADLFDSNFEEVLKRL